MDAFVRNERWVFPFVSLFFFIVTAGVALSLARRVYVRRQFAAAHGCMPPASWFPHRRFTLGLDYVHHHAVNIARHRFVAEFRALFDTLGPTYVARVFGKYVVHTVEPANLRAVMTTSFDDYTIIPARERLVATLFGKGLFATTGAEWARSRAVVRQSLGRLTLDEPTFEKHAAFMIEDIRAGETDFYRAAFRFAIDLAADLYFGESTRAAPGSEEHARCSEFVDGFSFLGQIARSLTLTGRRSPYVVDLLYWRRFRSAKREVENIVEAHVRAAQAGGDKPVGRTTLAQAMADATTDAPRARREIMNLLLAGNDTIAIALSEQLWLLARHPEVWAKLRTSILDASGEGAPSHATLKKIPYLTHVVNEGFRLTPPLAVHGRLSVRDTVLPRGGGHDGADPLLVPAGSYVVYSNYALNREKSVFGQDVDTFRPERWAEVAPGRFEYLGFGAGPRACPGERLGRCVLTYALARLAQAFVEVAPADERPWQEAAAFTFFNRNGVRVAFKSAKTA